MCMYRVIEKSIFVKSELAGVPYYRNLAKRMTRCQYLYHSSRGSKIGDQPRNSIGGNDSQE